MPGTISHEASTQKQKLRVNIPQTNANDLLVLTSNPGAKTINLEGYGGPDSGITTAGSVTGDVGIFNLYPPGTTTPLDTSGSYNLISESGGYTGGIANLSVGDLPSDQTASFGIGSNGDLQVTLTQVPEPVSGTEMLIWACPLLLDRRGWLAAE